MEEKLRDKERFFSVELDSKDSLKNVALTSGPDEGVLVEGTIGELAEANFVEEVILEIVGRRGILRINLMANELRKTSGGSAAGKNVDVREDELGEVR
jgi:hypothetical protein